jgi:hypothetical protein
MSAGIFIDDSGNPGTQTENKYDSTDRKSWYAIVLTASQRDRASSIMKDLIAQNSKEFGVNEFHFTDIFSGIKAYKGVSIQRRMRIFEDFAELFREMKYPILSMTMSSEDYQRSKIQLTKGKYMIDGLNMSRHEDFSLCYLLLRCHYFLKKNWNNSTPVEVTIDAGRQKDGSTQIMAEFKSNFIDRTIKYTASEKEPMLQLADYAAFCLNKGYWLQNKGARTNFDIEWLKIFAWADFQTLNMKRMYSDPTSDTKATYEKMLDQSYSIYDDRGNVDLAEMLGQLDWNNP